MSTSYNHQVPTASNHLHSFISPPVWVSPPIPQLCRATRSLVSGGVVLVQRCSVLELKGAALACRSSTRCLCTLSACAPGGVLLGCMNTMIFASLGSIYATVCSRADGRSMGGGGEAAATWLECVTMAELLSGAVTSGQCCRRADLMQRVTTALPLIMRLPFVDA